MRRFKLLAAGLGAGALATGVAAAASSPAVVTGGHGTIKQTSAVLDGTVNPNGSATTYYLRWGLTAEYGVNGSPHSAGGGTKPVAVSTTASGLIPGTRYHYQLVAVNRYGTSAGADRTFTTAGHPPPVVATGPATQLGSSFATLTGVVNPQGEQTSWQFQYGPSIAYGSSTFGGTSAAGQLPVTVSSALQGLASGTIFHYRLIAQHPGSAIVSYGVDQTFMTYPSPRPVAGVRARTAPHRKRNQPFLFTTSGSVAGPSWIPQAYACSGEVTIKSFFGARRVGFAVATVQPNCTFAAQTQFFRKPGRGPRNRQVRLNVFVRFLGNGYLAPVRARREAILLG
jgi:phosphodiesterase/alkaline phosphatase D-like protein